VVVTNICGDANSDFCRFISKPLLRGWTYSLNLITNAVSGTNYCFFAYIHACRLVLIWLLWASGYMMMILHGDMFLWEGPLHKPGGKSFSDREYNNSRIRELSFFPAEADSLCSNMIWQVIQAYLVCCQFATSFYLSSLLLLNHNFRVKERLCCLGQQVIITLHY
jgi:hypothetical protein